MSRFFVSGYNSESSSEEEDLVSSDEELLTSDSEFANDSESESDSDSDSEGRPTGPAYFLKKSFLKGSADDDSDSDSDEGRRVVKSAKDKLLDDMEASIETINVNKRSNNWTVVLNEFDKLTRYIIRAGQQNIAIPNFYIKCLASLEDYINETNENEKAEKSLNAAEARSFNATRLRVRKQIKEYQLQYDLFRDKPDLFDREESVDVTPRDGVNDQGEYAPVGSGRAMGPIFIALKQIIESRGKKNIDKFEQIQTLDNLLSTNLEKGSAFELIAIYQILLSIRFDASSNQNFMPVDEWKKNEADLNALLDVLYANIDSYQLSELGSSTDEIDIEPEARADGVKVMFGSVTSLIDRLDDEFTRSLQNTDPHSIEYVERLKDESSIYKLIVRGQSYIELITPEEIRTSSEQLARITLRRLEHIYYKPNQLITANEAEAWKGIEIDSALVSKNATPTELIESINSYLNKHANSIYGKHSLLNTIYYYAVNNNYSTARELFLSSQLYGSINHAESTLQVQYNRAIVQLGLSAFRSGAIEESHKILNEIVNSQRSKELLGQGFNSKYPNQATTAERQKLLPFHQHINLELLECVYMTCSLLIEIPALAQASNSAKDSKRKASIKSFKSKLEFHDRQFFTGPPESIKDHIVHASIALQKGDWSKSYELLSGIKIWKLFPDNDDLLSMLKSQLQVEGLRTYVFTYKGVYTKLSIAKLSKVFDLDNDKIYQILEKMVESNEIGGTFDETKLFINFTSAEPQRSRLQELAIVMNEKVGLLTEKNEKTASNGYGKKQNQPQGQQNNNQQNNQNKQQNNQNNQNQSQDQSQNNQQQGQTSGAPQQQQGQQQQNQRESEDNNRFRYANVNANNDEFQAAV